MLEIFSFWQKKKLPGTKQNTDDSVLSREGIFRNSIVIFRSRQSRKSCHPFHPSLHGFPVGDLRHFRFIKPGVPMYPAV